MVDPHTTGMPQRRAEHLAIRAITEFGETIGTPGRLVPVLPVPIEVVGRGTHRNPRRQCIAEGPRVGAAALHTHRQVVYDTDVHPRSAGGVLRECELLVAQPLQPSVEVDALGQHGALMYHPGIVRRGRPLVPADPTGPGLLCECAPQCEVVECAAALGAECRIASLTGCPPGHTVDTFEHFELGSEGRISLQAPGLVVRLRAVLCALVEELAVLTRKICDLGNVFDPQVQRIDEPSRRRKIRRRLVRGPGLRRVHRVDQYEVAAVARGHRREIGEVGEITDTPRPA